MARRHGLPVIEDCSQAYCATSGGRRVGTIGDIGCFSMQQSKHFTVGDGGLTMLLGDLITAVTHRLPVRFVVFDNGRLGMVKPGEHAYVVKGLGD